MEISMQLTSHWVTIKGSLCINYEKGLKILIEISDRGGERAAYRNLAVAYRSLGDYQKAIEYHEKGLKF